jgi:hypothetical protein
LNGKWIGRDRTRQGMQKTTPENLFFWLLDRKLDRSQFLDGQEDPQTDEAPQNAAGDVLLQSVRDSVPAKLCPNFELY